MQPCALEGVLQLDAIECNLLLGVQQSATVCIRGGYATWCKRVQVKSVAMQLLSAVAKVNDNVQIVNLQLHICHNSA